MVRCSGDYDLLLRLAVNPTLRTVPDFLSHQDFGRGVRSQTVMEADGTTSIVRYLDADAVKGLVCCAGIRAFRTLQATDMLTSEKVGHLAAVAMQIPLILAFRCEKVRRPLSHRFFLGCKGSQGITSPIDIEVFVKRVYQEVQKLFGVLLSVNAPFSIQASADFLSYR